jgi:dihydropyrimidine dehydrogenase (NAD+) subunit PreA
MCKMVNETKADWVELNVSCPFAADMGVKMGAGDVDRAPLIVSTCASILKKPFSVKISPQASDPVAIAEAVEKAGGMAVNLSARFSGFMIDIETASPIGPGAQGGWGGPYLLGYGLKIVSNAAKRLKIPIIAGLGVWEWQDIIRYTMCGASLVQSGVGIMLQGYNVTKKWNDNVNIWLDSKGYNSLDEIRGIALPNILKTKDVVRAAEGVYANVDANKCNKCGVCTRSCFYDAIHLTKVGSIVDTTKCDGCGLCKEVCPENAIAMTAPRARAATV